MSSDKGRTVRLFLVDGSPTGLITAEIMNWTGHALVAPRSRLVDVMKREEAARTGIYFLVGEDPAMPSKSLIYIGESDNVGKRITQHNKDESKDFWNRLCLVTSKDQNLTKAHVRYLESRLIANTQAAGRGNVANGTASDYGYLPESDIADMEYFLAQIGVIMPVLGFDFLRERPKSAIPSEPAKAIIGDDGAGAGALELELSDRKFGVDARAIESDGEIIVLVGSTARAGTDYASNSYGTLRQQLIADGRLKDTDNAELLVFTEDVPFRSPSAASAVIFDRNDNGRRSWRVKGTNKTLAQWQDAQASANVSD